MESSARSLGYWILPSTYPVVGARGLAALSTEPVQGLEANVHLSRTGRLGTVSLHKIWLHQGAAQRFLGRASHHHPSAPLTSMKKTCLDTPSPVLSHTHKAELFRYFDLAHNASTYVVGEAGCVADTKAIGT